MSKPLPSFTMRKGGAPSSGDWFRIENKGKTKPASIYIYDEIGFWGTSASDFIKALNEIESDLIDLHLNSPGGEIFDGLAIYNGLRQHKATVTVYVDALAASAASFIAMAGDKIIMMRGAQMMIHDGIGVCFGNEADMMETGQLLARLSDNIADIYSQRVGSSVEYWRSLMKEETWFSAEEAVTYGLADSVDDAEDPEAEKAVAKWDLSFFNFAGREHAESPTRVRERVLVTNTTKEKDMPAGQKNTTSQPESATTPEGTTPAPAEPTPAPNAPVPGPDGANPESDDNAAAASGENNEAQTDDTGAGVTPPTQQGPGNSTGVLINGKMVTDWQAIQNHIASQQTALDTTRDESRKAFVAKLAEDGRILASDIDSQTAFALTLDAGQYASWSALYSSAPKQNILDSHGQQASTTPASGSSAAAGKEDRIAVLEGVVAMLAHSMSQDQINNSAPYLELKQLKEN